MAPSLEEYEDAVSSLPVKSLTTNINGTDAVTCLQLEEAEKHDLVLRVFRCLIADLCENFKGGHPGYVTQVLRLVEAMAKFCLHL